MADPTPISNDETIPDDESRDDERSDIEQAVEARSDAVAREGGAEPVRFTDAGEFDGAGGTGGEVKNQDLDQQ